ncbi:MAG: glycosyltransferase, partial [Chloroflexi bacterium]|nr:glycosyltransferase [Chloroflexota bacterium]
IADASASLPITFHVYGSSLIDGDLYSHQFTRHPNVEYHGSFDGFADIPPTAYDVFLHTAQWEGLPNILMEAIATGLPVIAADVGGVRELIRNHDTGFLITPYDDVAQYVRCLHALHRDPSLLTTVLANAHRLLNERHSWRYFVATLQAQPGYTLPQHQTTPHASHSQCSALPYSSLTIPPRPDLPHVIHHPTASRGSA